MELKKEERSEYVAIYVTPTLKKEFECAKDNQTLKEDIIKRYLSSERTWLEDELKQIDESTIKYSAKLIGIKEAFEKTQAVYIQETEIIYNKAYETFKKLDSVAENTRKSIENTKSNLYGMLTQISTIDFYKVEQMLTIINKVNSMGNNELDLLKKLLN